jgi:hypothetical protein
MYRSLCWPMILTVALACRESRSGVPETGPPDLAFRTGSAEQEDNEAGMEYEAPRLIPAVRAQMMALQAPERVTTENLTAFRQGVAHMTEAMRADLQRVGVTDSGSFRALSDSLMREFGGGPGSPADLEKDQLQPAVAQTERLIGMYEQRMRAAAK